MYIYIYTCIICIYIYIYTYIASMCIYIYNMYMNHMIYIYIYIICILYFVYLYSSLNRHGHINTVDRPDPDLDWWFGCHGFYVFHRLGCESSQLTNIFERR